jgi:hypothetical protein
VPNISKRFLFRFNVLCRYTSATGVCGLDESYRLPDLSELEEEAKVSPPLDLRVGWNETGIFFSLNVSGKKQHLWCRAASPEQSDGIQICLDTRNIKDIHRATRFCHRLLFLPEGNRLNEKQPAVFWLPIHRAKDHPNPIDLARLELRSRITADGYQLDAFIPGKVLTGFDPAEYPNLGFHFALLDREQGNRYFSVEPPLPHDQDPSIWGTLEMSRTVR